MTVELRRQISKSWELYKRAEQKKILIMRAKIWFQIFGPQTEKARFSN